MIRVAVIFLSAGNVVCASTGLVDQATQDGCAPLVSQLWLDMPQYPNGTTTVVLGDGTTLNYAVKP